MKKIKLFKVGAILIVLTILCLCVCACEPQHVHKGSWVINKEATCTEEGSKTFTCDSCDFTQTVTIPKASHSLDYVSSYRPTETSLWYDEYSCKNCGEKIKEECLFINGSDADDMSLIKKGINTDKISFTYSTELNGVKITLKSATFQNIKTSFINISEIDAYVYVEGNCFLNGYTEEQTRAIKVGDNSNLYFRGDGSLTINGYIESGSDVIFDGQAEIAVNNANLKKTALTCDNLTVKSGKVTINSGYNGIVVGDSGRIAITMGELNIINSNTEYNKSSAGITLGGEDSIIKVGTGKVGAKLLIKNFSFGINSTNQSTVSFGAYSESEIISTNLVISAKVGKRYFTTKIKAGEDKASAKEKEPDAIGVCKYLYCFDQAEWSQAEWS